MSVRLEVRCVRRFRGFVRNPLWLLALTALLVQPGLSRAQAPAKGQGAVPPAPKAAAPAAGNAPAAPPPAQANPPAAAPPAAVPRGPIQDDNDPRVKAACAKAANYLRNPAVANSGQIGELSLAIHALAKIKEKFPDIVSDQDPAFAGMISRLRAACQGGFRPTRSGGHDNYEAGCAVMALSAADGQLYLPEITYVADYIARKQRLDGGWSYDSHPVGDTSQTQYAILGLWEAADGAGVAVPKQVWDNAAKWLTSTQTGSGGFCYQPQQHPEPTHTMTVGSLGSLYICRDHLPGVGGKRRNTRGVLLQVKDEEDKEERNFKGAVSGDALNGAIDRATAWLTSHFTLDHASGETDSGGGRWFYYYLYAFERFATLADLKVVANTDWYSKGAELIIARQHVEGKWEGGDGDIIQTSFACLFLVRSTKVSIKKHERRLGRGTLVSGKGLPQNLADLELEGGKLKPKTIRGKTGDLLSIIAAGKADAEGAARGLLQEMYTKKWSVGEDGDKLRKMYENGVKTKNSEAIKASLKLLSVTGDYRVVPILIDALYYEEDDEVQLAARDALCLISRKFPGKYTGETTEEWIKEIERWRAWYKSVRPEADLEDEFEIK